MSKVTTEPGVGVIKDIRLSESQTTSCKSCGTFTLMYKSIRHLLSERALRRTDRHASVQRVSNEHLIRIAHDNPPPQAWYDCDEPCPF